jgi:VRR-NUC domain
MKKKITVGDLYRSIMSHPEQDIQIAICDYLRLLTNIVFFHVPNSTYVSDKSGKSLGYLAKQRKLGVTAGVPDLVVMFRDKYDVPRTVCFEVKAEKGFLSDSQKSIIGRIENTGNRVFVVRSVDEVAEHLISCGYSL